MPRYCACGKRAGFGEPGTKRVTHCKLCKLPGYVDVVSKKCQCGKSKPSFGARAGDRPTRCLKCKLPGYVDVRNKKCQKCGKSQPSFGARAGDKPTGCLKCKLPGWINVRNPKCQCGKSKPSFGEKLGDKPTGCSACKPDGWIDVVNPKCQCGESQPSFGKTAGDKPSRCAACKPSDWIDVVSKRCLGGCGTRVDDIFCAGCDPKPGRRRQVRERRVFEALCADGLVPTKYDKAMDDTSCGRSRPDFFYDLPDRALMVECDEDQHSNYTPECELRRMVDLHAASGGLPTIFVRFNPDPFELDGVTHKRKRRHESLCTEIRRVMNMPAPLSGTLSVTYLYFDKITCAGVPPSDRGPLRRYVINTDDPRFPVTREL